VKPGLRILVAVAALVALSSGARAHETLHEVVLGRAVAVKAFFADGEVLAYTPAEIFSPADPKIPWQKGRTDRGGYVTFFPNVPGAWRVRVTDDTGHGLDVAIEVPAAGQAATASAGGDALGTAAFVLRPLVGLAVVGLAFAALILVYRRKGKTP